MNGMRAARLLRAAHADRSTLAEQSLPDCAGAASAPCAASACIAGGNCSAIVIALFIVFAGFGPRT